MTREVQMPCWLIRSAISTASTISALTVIAVNTKVFSSDKQEQRVADQAGVVLEAVERELALAHLADADPVKRQIAGVVDRVGQHQEHDQQRRRVHRQRERAGRELAPGTVPRKPAASGDPGAAGQGRVPHRVAAAGGPFLSPHWARLAVSIPAIRLSHASSALICPVRHFCTSMLS